MIFIIIFIIIYLPVYQFNLIQFQYVFLKFCYQTVALFFSFIFHPPLPDLPRRECGLSGPNIKRE